MFEEVKFKGTFRSYQQKILDNADKYLLDGRINVVAAPGSGKTVLGLELIRRLSKPCIIFSPTTTIRDQWGERFKEHFLPDGADGSAYVSYDLKNCSKITSVTYQALYSAVERVKCEDGEEVDYSDLDVFKTVAEAGIGTLCLDEAHHLQNDWQRALEKFVAALEGKVKIISLTATPPYDATPGEWNRFTAVCGEIDEEIFVPELVKQGNLCPHQDYVYFNCPTKEEARDFEDFKRRVDEALKELKAQPFLKLACDILNFRTADLKGWLDGNYREVAACLKLFKQFGLKPDKKLYKYIDADRCAPFSLETAETAVNFLAGEDGLLFKEQREDLLLIFKRRALLERGRITLTLNDKLKRKLVSSVGKLQSISKITELESGNLGEKLRLLVLTDYIRKESAASIGKDEKFDSLSVVSVFETVRKSCRLPCAAVSGSLVILPLKCAETLAYMGVNHTFKPIKNTEYAQFIISGGNREKVSAVGKLFERGEICALVGTKSLLGEGWDSPCINTLILASFVGSFMLSNQMRGRAIRTDKNDPEKTANIWHLVTVLPDGENDGEIDSYDFEVLERRFDCFVAPSYDFDRITSGIGRVGLLKPPYTEGGFKRINKGMRELSSERESLKDKWARSLAVSAETYRISEVPADRQFPAFTFYNLSREFLLLSLIGLVLCGIIEAFYNIADSVLNGIIAVVGTVIIVFFGLWFIDFLRVKMLKHTNPKKSIEKLTACLLKTFKDCGKIKSDCDLEVTANDIGTVINVKLVGATVREQKIFSAAVGELFAPIESQRYLLIPRGVTGYNLRNALACPNELGVNKDYVTLLADNLKRTAGKLGVVYTRNERGRKLLKKCRKRAYINQNSRNIEDLFGNY